MKLLILCNDRLALPALSQLLQMNIVAGVGMTTKQSEVHAVVNMMCTQSGVPLKLFQKKTFEQELEQWIEQFKSDAVWVKTFPWKIPERILNKPRFGFINFHYAPLPHYRGANPLFWMIRDGATEGGVTVHQMTAAMDDGPILLQSKVPLNPATTFGMLVSGLGFSGAELSMRMLQLMQSNNVSGKPQDSGQASWYKRPRPEDLWVNWNAMDAPAISRLVNACNPWNKGAPARMNGWMIGLTYVTASHENHDKKPGTILSIDADNGLKIACRENTVIRADIVFTEEGFIPGHALAGFGIREGTAFS